MKRFHVHLSVPDLDASVRFYSGLFGASPAVQRDDYAKWMLDDPRVNFAITQRGSARTGLDHLGLQAESQDELAAIHRQFQAADPDSTVAEPNAHCCYAISDKHWVRDPQGIAWEAFHTLGSLRVDDAAAACGPACNAETAAPSTPDIGPTQGKPGCCGPLRDVQAPRARCCG